MSNSRASGGFCWRNDGNRARVSTFIVHSDEVSVSSFCRLLHLWGEAMINGYQALTEKEKETLRLLVSGYDAKSMARQLGLSVHTINERLRDARRKMAVSSSR